MGTPSRKSLVGRVGPGKQVGTFCQFPAELTLAEGVQEAVEIHPRPRHKHLVDGQRAQTRFMGNGRCCCGVTIVLIQAVEDHDNGLIY